MTNFHFSPAIPEEVFIDTLDSFQIVANHGNEEVILGIAVSEHMETPYTFILYGRSDEYTDFRVKYSGNAFLSLLQTLLIYPLYYSGTMLLSII